MTTALLHSSTPLAEVVGADLSVPLVQGGTVRYANLDIAASAPALTGVAARVAEALPYYASIHRGAGYPSALCTALYERARQTVARFAGARPEDTAVFTRNTTDALNLLARCLPEEAETVFLGLEHHANLLPWQARPHRCVPVRATLAGTLEALEAELARRPAALLAVTGASNVTGELLPLPSLVRIAHRHGARIVLDAAQLAPHRRLDLAADGVDYAAFSGHKLYAPYGSGVLVGRRDWLEAARPYLGGGGAVREVRLSGTTWADAPQRHEGGTPNVLGALALSAACELVEPLLDGGRAERHEAELTARLRDGLAALPGVRTLRIWPDSSEAIGIVCFTVAGQDAGKVAAFLSAEHGVGVRDGRFCAHPLARHLGLDADGAVRASLGLGSAQQDVDQLLEGLGALLASGPRWSYARVDGRWSPVPDPRPLPDWAAPAADAAPLAGPASPCTAGD